MFARLSALGAAAALALALSAPMGTASAATAEIAASPLMQQADWHPNYGWNHWRPVPRWQPPRWGWGHAACFDRPGDGTHRMVCPGRGPGWNQHWNNNRHHRHHDWDWNDHHHNWD